MSRLLLTGFLGSGKTTVLKSLLPALPGRTAVIINEYGRENVDGALLERLGIASEGICGGSVFCACRMPQYIAALERAKASGADTVVTETSGLSDPGEFSAVASKLGMEAGCVCVADARAFEKVYTTAAVVSAQIKASGSCILNKADLVPPEKLAALSALIRRVNAIPVWPASWGRVPPEAFETVAGRPCGSVRAHTRDRSWTRLRLIIPRETPEKELRGLLARLSPHFCRIKGFVTLREGNFFADCTLCSASLSPSAAGGTGLDALCASDGDGAEFAARAGVKCEKL